MKHFILSLIGAISAGIFASPVRDALSTKMLDGDADAQAIVPVHYIESTGEQYIITSTDDCLYEPDLVVDLVLSITRYNDGCIGCYKQPYENNFYINFFNNKIYFRIGTYYPSGMLDGWNTSGKNTVRMAKYDPSYNGITLTTDGSFLGIADPFVLFAKSHSFYTSYQINGFMYCRLYSATFSIGGDVMHDYIPVRALNEDGAYEGALYDIVTGEVLRNQGTGSFVIGPDL